MAWVREDDREASDGKIAKLADREYRELHALRQYVAREHPGAGGIFERSELGLISYATPKGVRTIRPSTIARFLELRLLRTCSSYSRAELDVMRASGKQREMDAADAIEDAKPDAFRPNRWEFYASPVDRTRNERQARWKAQHRMDAEDEGEGNGVSNALGNSSTRAVVPSQVVTTPTVPKGAEADDLDFGGALRVARVLQAVGGASLEDADTLRGLTSRSSEATVAKLLESLAGGSIVNPVAYAVTMLRKELAK